MTLIEAVMSTLIVGVMLVAALSSVSSSARAGLGQRDRCRAPNLARQLLAEILQTAYAEPDDTPAFGPEGPESADARTVWDDVDDYHGWSACPPVHPDGSPVATADGWTREVTVEYVRPDDPATPAGSDAGLKRITVTVTAPTGARTSLRTLRGRAGVADRRPAETTDYVTAVGVELQIGGDEGGRVVGGARLLRPVPLPH